MDTGIGVGADVGVDGMIVECEGREVVDEEGEGMRGVGVVDVVIVGNGEDRKASSPKSSSALFLSSLSSSMSPSKPTPLGPIKPEANEADEADGAAALLVI